jgi:hypothetical protein
MLPRIKPVMLLGLVAALVLSLAISAGAQQLLEGVDVPLPGVEQPVDLAVDAPLPGVEQPVDLAVDAPLPGVEQPVDVQQAVEGAGELPEIQQQPTGGGGGSALGIAEAQLGKPFMMSTDGPDTFSCVGLMRYALRESGIDPDAPWVPEEYLSRYAPVDAANIQPGDIVIYPNWATMYAGNGMLVNANEMEGVVTHTPMDAAGAPLGIVRP